VYDAGQVIARLPAEQRETGTIGAVSAVVGLASVSAEVVVSLYGVDNRYQGSRWVDVAVHGEPAAQTRYSSGGVSRIILGVHRYPGNLRRIDLGRDVV
jgi:hypothetical protein